MRITGHQWISTYDILWPSCKMWKYLHYGCEVLWVTRKSKKSYSHLPKIKSTRDQSQSSAVTCKCWHHYYPSYIYTHFKTGYEHWHPITKCILVTCLHDMVQGRGLLQNSNVKIHVRWHFFQSWLHITSSIAGSRSEAIFMLTDMDFNMFSS